MYRPSGLSAGLVAERSEAVSGRGAGPSRGTRQIRVIPEPGSAGYVVTVVTTVPPVATGGPTLGIAQRARAVK